MVLYLDPSSEGGCVSVFAGEGNSVIYTGTEVHTEPENLREHPLAVRLARDCDFHLWFRDDAPEAPFYTVPRTIAAGYDSRGGYFAAVEEMSLDWSTPLYYIDSRRVCHQIAPVGKTAADMGKSWRENMTVCADIEVFADRAEAQRKYPIRDLAEILEERK